MEPRMHTWRRWHFSALYPVWPTSSPELQPAPRTRHRNSLYFSEAPIRVLQTDGTEITEYPGASNLAEPARTRGVIFLLPAQDGVKHLLPPPSPTREQPVSRWQSPIQPIRRPCQCRPMRRQSLKHRSQSSSTICISGIQNLFCWDTGSVGGFSLPHGIEPSLHGRPGSDAFEFTSQILLHGLMPQGRAGREFIPNFLWDVPDSDLNGHACILHA